MRYKVARFFEGFDMIMQIGVTPLRVSVVIFHFVPFVFDLVNRVSRFSPARTCARYHCVSQVIARVHILSLLRQYGSSLVYPLL